MEREWGGDSDAVVLVFDRRGGACGGGFICAHHDDVISIDLCLSEFFHCGLEEWQMSIR